MAEPETKVQVIANAKRMLTITKRGLDDMRATQEGTQLAGLMNLAVFGRAVTQMLQNMRTHDRTGFDTWYESFQAEMRSDPLMKYFYDLRTEVLKEGPPRPQYGFLLRGPFTLSPGDGPPGSKSVALTPTGLVYRVEMPDGSTMAYHAPFPPEARWEAQWHMPDPPESHLGIPIDMPDLDIVSLATKFVAYLEKFVSMAEAHFLE